MAIRNDDDQNNVMGLNQPQQGGMNTPQQPQASGGDPSLSGAPAGGATIQPGSAPSTSSPQAPRSTSQKGSGSFTNIADYQRINAPRAQQMAGAAVKQTETEAQKIGQQVKRQQEAFQQNLGQAQQTVQAERQFGQQLTQNLTGGQKLADTDYSRFRDVLTGQKQFQNVNDINLAQAQEGSQRLQQKAQAAETEQGRQNLLRDAFSNRGREYTAGQSSLDNLITGGSEAARRQLAEGVREQAKLPQESISQARRQALEGLAGYRQEIGGLADQFRGFGQTGVSSVLKDVDAAKAQQILNRQAAGQKLTAQEQKVADALKTAGQQRFGNIQQDLATFAELIKGNAGDIGKTTYALDQVGYGGQTASDAVVRDYGANFEAARQGLLDQLLQNKELELLGTNRTELVNRLSAMEQGRGIANVQDLLDLVGATQQQFAAANQAGIRQNLTGDIYSTLGQQQSLQDFLGGKDISRQTAATAQDYARYNALQDLLQGRNLGTRELSDLRQAGSAGALTSRIGTQLGAELGARASDIGLQTTATQAAIDKARTDAEKERARREQLEAMRNLDIGKLGII